MEPRKEGRKGQKGGGQKTSLPVPPSCANEYIFVLRLPAQKMLQRQLESTHCPLSRFLVCKYCRRCEIFDCKYLRSAIVLSKLCFQDNFEPFSLPRTFTYNKSKTVKAWEDYFPLLLNFLVLKWFLKYLSFTFIAILNYLTSYTN